MAARSLAGSARALLLGVLALSACSAGDDASPPRTDGGARDGGVVYLDAALDFSAPTDSGAAPDAGPPPVCETTPCDPRLALACGPEATNGCRLDAEGPVCVGTLGTMAEGDECASANDCAAGLDCFAAIGGSGICRTPCCPGDDSMCGLGGRCATEPMLVDGTVAPWGRCVPARPCDVLQREAVCDPGEGCYIVSSRGDTDCRSAGTVDVGGSCDGESACLPGLFCAGLMARTCVRICALGDGGPGVCPSSEGSCQAFAYSPVGTGICS